MPFIQMESMDKLLLGKKKTISKWRQANSHTSLVIWTCSLMWGYITEGFYLPLPKFIQSCVHKLEYWCESSVVRHIHKAERLWHVNELTSVFVSWYGRLLWNRLVFKIPSSSQIITRHACSIKIQIWTLTGSFVSQYEINIQSCGTAGKPFVMIIDSRICSTVEELLEMSNPSTNPWYKQILKREFPQDKT